jgi:hypothetical protein
MYKTLVFIVLLTASVKDSVSQVVLSAKDTENVYALLIGNEDYQSQHQEYVLNFPNAIRETENFYRILTKEYGIPENNIRMVFNATQTHLKLALTKFSAQAGNKKATVIVYYNGKISLNAVGDIILENTDIDESNLAFALSTKDLVERIEKLGLNAIVLVDALKDHTLPKNNILEENTNLEYPSKTVRVYAATNRVKEQTQIINIQAQREAKVYSKPEFEFIEPYEDFFATNQSTLLIQGRISPVGNVKNIALNGSDIHIDDEGFFKAKIPLQEGTNNLYFLCIDSEGQKIKHQKTVYQESNNEAISANTKSNRESSIVSDTANKIEANNYALIIGINNYESQQIPDLLNPVNDAEKLATILKQHYNYSDSNIKLLKNPNREQIIVALDVLEKTLTENDNLLIFYAGHGHWDKQSQRGYWLPSNASHNNTSNWIRNSTISGYISGIPTAHTLLIADACFSGGIFRTRAGFSEPENKAYERLYKLPSRKAMTSGTLKVVPDESVFMKYLMKRLQDNSKAIISAEELFFDIKKAVMNNSDNVPQYGVIRNAGDEGGDFLFVQQ